MYYTPRSLTPKKKINHAKPVKVTPIIVIKTLQVIPNTTGTPTTVSKKGTTISKTPMQAIIIPRISRANETIIVIFLGGLYS